MSGYWFQGLPFQPLATSGVQYVAPRWWYQGLPDSMTLGKPGVTLGRAAAHGKARNVSFLWTVSFPLGRAIASGKARPVTPFRDPPYVPATPLFNWYQTVISQYANSPILLQLLDNFFQYIDQTSNMDDFYNLMWNVDTAVGYGLDVWGRIVGVSRTLELAQGEFFGFAEGNPSWRGFNQAPFWGGASATDNFELSDQAYRQLIFAKAMANICDGSIMAINQLLLNLFPGLGGYVVDNNDMTITYTFTKPLSDVQVAIVKQSGVLPRPTGVFADMIAPSGICLIAESGEEDELISEDGSILVPEA
jgi:hypothetical protein